MGERTSTTITSTALTVWLRMVAQAAPATPMSRPITRNRSSTMFVMQAAIRKYSGLRESPTARRMPLPTL